MTADVASEPPGSGSARGPERRENRDAGPTAGPARKISRRPRIFSSRLSATERRVYGAVAGLFVAVFLAFMWPIYPLFSRIRPLVLGMPLSLAYLVGLLLVSFLTLLVLYRWEDRRGKIED